MYQPGHGKFVVEDPLALLTELARHGPATLVSHGDEGFRTTILPLMASLSSIVPLAGRPAEP